LIIININLITDIVKIKYNLNLARVGGFYMPP
jgi:hypothetical protein